ncbi:MAG: metallophosphoesterase [Planctomycetota bacterium]|nr:metallophosphoesterase [Planctomycetota bacterium]
MPRWVQVLILLSIVVPVYGGMHYYVYRRFLTAAGPLPPTWLWFTRVFLTAMMAGFFLVRFFRGASPHAAMVALYWLFAVWLGFLFYVFVLTLAAHLTAAAARVCGYSTWAFLGSRPGLTALAVVVAMALVVAGYGFREARGAPRTTELEVPVKNLPSGMDGFSIVQFCDLHNGLVVGESQLRRIVERINALDPDLVVITGDLADESASDFGDVAPLLGELRARHGVLAVTGNHDYYAGAENVVRHAEAAGVRFLRNEQVSIGNGSSGRTPMPPDNEGLLVYGMEDPTARSLGGPWRPLEEVIGPEARTRPAILLRHQQIGLSQARALGLDLVLSGHTHGGQLWPFGLVVGLFQRHVHGLYQADNCRLYVSSGAGTWGPPMRVGAPPEIVRIRLRAALVDGAATGTVTGTSVSGNR